MAYLIASAHRKHLRGGFGWNTVNSFTIIFFTSYDFNLPEPKAQVSFSDHNLSVVRRRCPRRRWCRCRKLFTFSSSSPEPLDQFQPNLAQSVLG